MQVHIGYAQRARNYNLTPTRRHLGKAIAHGSKLSIALQCLKDKQIQKHIIRKISQLLRSEIVKLCSHEVGSVLRQQSRESLMGFTWNKIIEEASQHAPLLLELLKCCTSTKRPRANRHSVISMCIAMLCKVRCNDMSSAHKVLSIILYSGHSSKQVCMVKLSVRL